MLNQVENCWDNTATAPAAGRGASYLDLSHAPGQGHGNTFLYIYHYISTPVSHVLMLKKTRSCSVSWCRWAAMKCKSMTSESWLRGDITSTGHHWSPQCLWPEAFLSIGHTLWNPTKLAGEVGESQFKSMQNSWQICQHQGNNEQRRQILLVATGKKWLGTPVAVSPCGWPRAGTGEEEEWGLASAKHCQASIENTISYPPPSRRPATTASTSSVQMWRKIKFWILNSDLHVHFASDVGLCILSVMSECIMTPSILLG